MTHARQAIDLVTSDVAGTLWPPVARGGRAELLALMAMLERSQWLDPDIIARGQRVQLAALAAHAALHAPSFAARLATAGLTPVDLAQPGALATLPLLRRADLQRPAADVDCASVPDGHGPETWSASSGSTGEPVTVRKTALENRFWQALTLRWLLWSGADLGGRLAITRANAKQVGPIANWGAPVATLFNTGPALIVNLRDDYDAIAAAFAAFDPHIIQLYPSGAAALLDRIDAGAVALPSLAELHLLGETVPDALRDRVRGRYRLSSCYSTAELGYIAIECPDSDLHHIASEGAIVEILRDDGTPAAEGEAGRVVVTALHNFKTPLVRYETGDWAEPGPACPCGRGLPTLRRILGRTRNRMTLPDGRTRWSFTGSVALGDLPVAQVQLVQHSRDNLELRYTTHGGPLSAEQVEAVRATVRGATHPGFTIALTPVDGRLDNPANGKFEEFVSLLP